MLKFFIKWLVNIVTLFIVIHTIAGVSADSWETIIVAAFILGLLNAFIKPFIILVTLPITVLTMGFFTLIINAFLFIIASKFVKGFEVISFWSAFWAALLFSIISSILNFILAPKISINSAVFPRTEGRSRKIDDGNAIDVEGKVED